MIRQGEVYWLDDCPPLDGGQPKRRPVIVLSTPQQLKSGTDEILIVACSSTVTELDDTRIPLPNASDQPWSKSGLDRPTWALPRWYLVVRRNRLVRPAGHIKRPLLATIIERVLAAMQGSS